MTLQQNRMFRIDWLKARIRAADKLGVTVDKERLVAEFCCFFGATRRYALEYLNQIIITEKLIIRDNEIFGPITWEAEQLLGKPEIEITKSGEVKL